MKKTVDNKSLRVQRDRHKKVKDTDPEVTVKVAKCGYPTFNSKGTAIGECQRPVVGKAKNCDYHIADFERMLEDVKTVKNGVSEWLSVRPSKIPHAEAGIVYSCVM